MTDITAKLVIISQFTINLLKIRVSLFKTDHRGSVRSRGGLMSYDLSMNQSPAASSIKPGSLLLLFRLLNFSAPTPTANTGTGLPE